jgi:hypothetical protein
MVAATAVFFTIVGQAQVTGPQPSIASVTGSLNQGSTLTIAGANLHAETMQYWDSRNTRLPTAWSFEGSSPTADGYGQGGPGGRYDSNVKLLGNQSMRFRSAITNPNCTTGIGQDYANLGVDDAANRNEMWVRAYVRYNRLSAYWPNNFIKMLEPLNSGYYFQPDGRQLASGENPFRWYILHNGVSLTRSNPGGNLQNHRWYAVELHFRASPPIFEAWVDGTQVYSATPTYSAAWQLFLFGVINACGTQSWDIEMWVDGLVLGSRRLHPSTMVEVGNSSSYSTATRKVQPLESIADDQVRFRLDTSGLGSGPYYMWVRNNAQQLSPAYFLTGGQISGPVAPTNLRIVP